MKELKTMLPFLAGAIFITFLIAIVYVVYLPADKTGGGSLNRLSKQVSMSFVQTKSSNNPATGKEEKTMITWKDVLKYANEGNLQPDSSVNKSDAEWRKLLSPEQYQITRQKGTEKAYSSDMCSLFEPGIYACVCCGTLLFDSGEKFESGTGWPSFTQPIKTNAIAYHLDNSYGMQRVETLCNTCGAHLGHVFPDGPEPSGLRYCINALALKKIKK